jgi:hypothetical protein
LHRCGDIGCGDITPARGGRRTRSWAIRFGLAGLALFAVSVVLLMQAWDAGKIK